MQAVILVGGEGTRLRPLTSTVPKPVVPLVDRPFIAFMLEWLARHGVDDVVMSCGFLATAVRNVLGDGSQYGLRLRFVEEPEPRGTAGALKYAEDLLDERFLMLNGDVLTDIDLTAQIAQHEATGAVGTLALVPVADPTAYGLVRLNDDQAVKEFVEKPSADQIDTRLISAGAYVLERAVLDLIPADRNVSIEREVWPQLVGKGLFGYAAEAYWLDIGTPERYLQGTFDILEGNVATAVAERLGPGYLAVGDRVQADGRIVPPALVERGCTIAAGAHVGSLVVLGEGVSVGEGTTIERSVVLNGAEIGADCVLRDCIVAAGVRIGDGLGDLRRRRARRGRDGGGAQRPHARRASLPADGPARRRHHVLRKERPILSSTEQLELDRETIGRIDPTDQLTDVLAIPEHLRDALWKVESAGLEPWDSPDGLVVAGMGGSAIGGHLARAILGDHASRPLLGARAYGLPPWTTPDTTVLCASYSGNTEETLACYEAAGVIGARRVVVTSGGKLAELARADQVPVVPVAGGFQPRAAVAYMTVAALQVAALCGVGPRHELRARRGRRPPRGARHRVGARGPARRAGQEPGPRHARHRARGGRRRADDADRLPLEDPGQREREDARPTRSSCPRWTTTRSSAGARPASSRASPPSSSTTPTPIRGSRSASTSRRGSSRRAPRACTASSRAARTRPSASSRSCCWATSCRSTSPRCAASTPSRSRSSTASRPSSPEG